MSEPLPFLNHGGEAPCLQLDNLTVAFDRQVVLDDITLSVPGGCLAGIVGPNGAGKSTLIRACLNMLPRVAGDIRFYGQTYRKQRKAVAYVPQRESVDWDFPVSVLDVVAMGTYGRLGWFRPVNKGCRDQAMYALEMVGLTEYANRQISKLSGGQQQRVFLARAIAQEADIYFMDEPFSAIDAATEEAIVNLLRQLREDGRSCFIVHHDLSTVSRYFDYTILLNQRLIAAGPTPSVFNRETLAEAYGKRLSFLDANGQAAIVGY